MRTLVILLIFITVVNLPAALFIVLWFILQLFSGLGSLAGVSGGIAYWAHIGGFAMGYLYARRLRRPRTPPTPRIINIDVSDL